MISYEYDSLNRLIEKSTSQSTVTYTYDAGSRLQSAADPEGTISYTYDALNRVNTVSYPGGKGISYEYDANGNRNKLTYPDLSYITYNHDNLNRLTDIKNSADQVISHYGYDALSRRTGKALLNGTSETYYYDAINRLTDIQGLTQFNYTYDKIANRKTMTTPAGTHNYTYDNIYQLKTADYPAGSSFSDTTFNYDNTGNRTSTVDGGTTNYTPNNLNQYSQIGAITPSYDLNGNLTNIATNTYSYDSENRLTNVVIPAQAGIQYAYDPFGRRISKTVDGVTTKFLYDGDQIIAEYDGSDNMTAKYINGASIDETIRMDRGANSYYYHYDGLGSVTNLTDSTGAVTESYSYDVFGKPSAVSTVGNRYMFTGREYDAETGLYYYRARYYSADLGRFLQTDPLQYIADINLYRYCYNNSVNWTDPSGLKVYIGSHPVGKAGGHLVIILIPDNEADFINNKERFTRNPATGQLEADISAGPEGNPLSPLLSPYGYGTDRITNPGMTSKEIKDPLGRSDTQLINDILNSAAQYANDKYYDPFALGGCYNSNSYVRGVLKGAGINNVPLPDKRFYPGWTKPVPLNK